MIIQEINNLIEKLETINEASKKESVKGTVEGLKTIGKGTATVAKGAAQAWKPLSAIAVGSGLYSLGKNSGKYDSAPTIAGLSALGGAAGMHYLHKKNERDRLNI